MGGVGECVSEGSGADASIRGIYMGMYVWDVWGVCSVHLRLLPLRKGRCKGRPGHRGIMPGRPGHT